MLHATLLVIVAIVPFARDAADRTTADRKTYEAVRLKAGQNPAALVKLALWCEAHGLTAERGKHLMEAVGIDPANSAARGLLGLISYRGKWLKPDEVRVERQSDAKLAKKLKAYHARRAAVVACINKWEDRLSRPPQSGTGA